MKILVETSGSFHLVDPGTGHEAPFDRPALMATSGFTGHRLQTGQLKMLMADIPDHITDAEWKVMWDKAKTVEAAFAALKAAMAPPPAPAADPNAGSDKSKE